MKLIFSDQRLDRVEQILLAVFYFIFLYRFLSTAFREFSIFNFIYLIDQTIVIMILLVRRSTEHITGRLSDWGAAIIGIVMPLLVDPMTVEPLLPRWICLTLYFSGSMLHIYAKIIIRRSFGAVPAHRGLKDGGPYRIIRHPMYLGYIVSQAWFLLAVPTLWNFSVLTIGWAAQIWRIQNEEQFLATDPAYRDYQQRVRYRLVPGLY